ncbi:zinc finger MYND domain-containing protein [Phanerochaete sordida]|uniref:Zinc finger MYND domain-containing protein n=1 Tax=Phanerochaete sordida TaxID=48140 RepID=A0A9P3GNK5_9APHY|nr:zinc finger MYND domain-containing protein [Phanerochaete sordida]
MKKFTDMEEVQRITQYASLRDACFMTARQWQARQATAGDGSTGGPLLRSTADVKRGVASGNLDDMLELALRLYTGASADQDRDSANTLCMTVLGAPNVSRSARGRALSMLAMIHWESRLTKDTPGHWNIDALYRAASFANEACTIGFTAGIACHIGFDVERAGFRKQEDVKFPGWSAARFEALTELWRIVDQVKGRMQREQAKRQEKLKKDPAAFVCAAPGCGIEETYKTTLRRCAGKCAMEGKPAYCDKDCQKKDWARHKAFCRDGAPLDDVVASLRHTIEEESKPINLADTDSYQPTLEFSEYEISSDGTFQLVPGSKKQEHRVDIPDSTGAFGGKDIKILSKNIDPDVLRRFRDLATESKDRKA